VLVASAVPVAVAANSFRVVMTGILANRYGAQVAQGFFHEFAGLAIFAVAMILLLAESFALRKMARHE
jgi:exosortase/archaeosortase family protein